MKKLMLLVAFATMLVVVGCEPSTIENEEHWKSVAIITYFPDSGEIDTINLVGSGMSSLVGTYYDSRYDKNFLYHTKFASSTKSLDTWYVNKKGVLYECWQPTRYIKSSDGKMVDNICWENKAVPTEDKTNANWVKVNEDTAYLKYYFTDTRQTWVFIRDRLFDGDK